jgi:hypothetical protein
LFKILKQIPQDGTFNQLKPIERLQNRFSRSLKGGLSSIDLSAATDRLPIELQVILLESLLKGLVPDPASFARSWADLLVKRDYLVVPDQSRLHYDFPDSLIIKGKEVLVRYSVGQPMGALSSWAMLAITHHAMMQFSSKGPG